MRKFKLIFIIVTFSIMLTACNSNKIDESLIEENIDVIETQNEIKEETITNNDNTNKKEESASNEDFNISDITNSADASTSVALDIEIKPDNTDLFTGKIIDSNIDISLWELPEGLDNNENSQVYDGNYNKFLFETNSYIIELSNNILLAKENVNDSINLEYYLDKVGINLESIDTKNNILVSNSVDDVELINAWNAFYIEVKSIELQDLANYDTKELNEKVSNISVALQGRLSDYDYFTDVYIDNIPTGELIEVEQ